MTPTPTTTATPEQTIEPRFDYAIVRHKETDALYIAHGNDEYTNLQTGVKGKMKPSTAKKFFVISLTVTQLFNKFPLLEQMVMKLGMVLEK